MGIIKKKDVVKKISILLSLAIFLSLLFGYISINITNNNLKKGNLHYENIRKVRFEGIGTITNETASEIAHRINKVDVQYTKLIIELDNSYEKSEKRPDNDISLEEAQYILKQQRKNVKEYFSRTNQEILESLDLSEFNIPFKADSYAPYIIGEFDRDITSEDIDNIYKLAENKNISVVYVKCSQETETELSEALNAIDSSDNVTSELTNGSGIVIGILDSGIVDKDNLNFEGVDLTIRKEWWFNETVDEHATLVASCALAVAPGASILSVEVSGEPSGEIGWMLDRGVNIINMSFGYTDSSEYGEYTSESAYCDYIARNNWVTFTASAGNRGESDKMITPPNGYNTITVGACSNFGTVSSYSSYKENFNINFPNLVAPGDITSIQNLSGSYSGTSLSAPLAAGAAAVLMRNTPALVNYPEHVLSILMASTQRISKYALMSGFNDQVGAGMLNLENALVAANNRMSFSMSVDNVGKFISSKQVYLGKGERIRIAFVSLINNNNSVNVDIITDYDLYLYDSNGKVVGKSRGLHNNEFIDFNAVIPGNYTIKIMQYSAKKTTMTDFCSYTYFIS